MVQVVRAIGALANSGTLVIPTLLSKDTESSLEARGIIPLVPDEKIAVTDPNAPSWYKVVREGMRETVTEGTMQQLNFPYVKIAGKTGTAQLGISKKNINSWAVGFFPYEKPKYAFAVMLESGPSTAIYGASAAMRQWVEWLHVYAPQYLGEAALATPPPAGPAAASTSVPVGVSNEQ